MNRTISLIRQSFPERPALSTAVSRALLMRVSRGELGPTLRLHRPGPNVAFGRRDVASPRYRAAVRAARAAGFEAVERLAGGRAAVFHEGTVAFARAFPDPYPPARTYERFDEVAGAVATALRGLGVDARVGEVPGEYCPGEHSVNARGRVKLAGIGQRIVSGGAHVGGVVVVQGGDRVRAALEPVYAALGLEWDPATAGSLEDELGAISFEEAERALVQALGGAHPLVEAQLDLETMRLAERLESQHRAPD